WERAPPVRRSRPAAPTHTGGSHPASLVPAPSGGGVGWGRVGFVLLVAHNRIAKYSNGNVKCLVAIPNRVNLPDAT
ncbi:MAG: hypothetical protein ACUVSL_14755, partial [Chloroflexus sp.]|uniref:hypothetical protein n=1 Tax=Chloroflexus sp. TaxID=1904827 RepID=UPI00404B0229